MTRWQVHISEETDRAVRTHLARTGGKKGDLSKFVDEAVRSEILRRTIREIQEQNADLTEQQAEELARSLAMLDQGMQDVKAGRGKPLKQAVRDLANELGFQLNQ